MDIFYILLTLIIFALLFSPAFFLLLYLSIKAKIRNIIRIAMIVSVLIACPLFLYIQTQLNTPDYGMEFQQFYLPLIIYFLVLLIGVLAPTRRKD